MTEARERTLASWEVNVSGLRWIEKLDEEGKATFDAERSSRGYPRQYSAPAGNVLPFIAGLIEQLGAGDWLKIMHLHRDWIERCPCDAILTVMAFDLD